MAFAQVPCSSATSSKRQGGSAYGRHMFMRSSSLGRQIILNGMQRRHAFAAAWRNQPKWSSVRWLKSVGSTPGSYKDDLEGAIRELRPRQGRSNCGPDFAQSLTELGLIDHYRILPAPRRAWARRGRFRRAPPVAPAFSLIIGLRGGDCDQVGLRSCLISRSRRDGGRRWEFGLGTNCRR